MRVVRDFVLLVLLGIAWVGWWASGAFWRFYSRFGI